MYASAQCLKNTRKSSIKNVSFSQEKCRVRLLNDDSFLKKDQRQYIKRYQNSSKFVENSKWRLSSGAFYGTFQNTFVENCYLKS